MAVKVFLFKQEKKKKDLAKILKKHLKPMDTHCIIHQQVLCGKYSNLSRAVETVFMVNFVFFIYFCGLKYHQFLSH